MNVFVGGSIEIARISRASRPISSNACEQSARTRRRVTNARARQRSRKRPRTLDICKDQFPIEIAATRKIVQILPMVPISNLPPQSFIAAISEARRAP